MKPEIIRQIVGRTPYMTLEQARRITEFIHNNEIKDVLELGFAHGVSTCYIAAALEETGKGSITTIDHERARGLRPSIEQFVEQCGYRNMVTIHYEPTSYTWRLMNFLEQDPSPTFDFCYIDGAHKWFDDGFAFFLVDRLLRPGGWIIFDDYEWTYASDPMLRKTDWFKNMPREERETPQVQKVYELLVKSHPNYDNFQVKYGWAYAHKAKEALTDPPQVRREVIYIDFFGFKKFFLRLKRTWLNALNADSQKSGDS
jgi:predicted O-methyltransferase YrrM